MDLLERVRDIQLDDTTFTDEQKNAARQVLLRGLAAKDRRPAQTQRSWIGAAGIVAATAAAAVIVAVVVTPTASPSAAAEALNRAAEATLETQDPALAAGEYLRITKTSRVTSLWDVDMASQISRFGNGDPRDADAALIEESTQETYVPSNQSDDWILTSSAPRVVDRFGDRVEEALNDREDLMIGGYPTENRTVERWPAGEVPPQGAIAGDRRYDTREAMYADMPRDPAALLAWFRAQANEDDADRFTIEQLGEDTMVNLAPRDLRESLFRALALIEGVSVASVQGNLTTLAYDWTFQDRHLQTTFTVDTEQGLIVGGSQIELTRGQPGFLATPFVASEWAATTEVVNSAP